MRRFAVAAALVAVASMCVSSVAAQGIINSNACVFNWTDPFTNQTWNYDLNPLTLPYGQDYRGFDDNVAYQYYWNVCGSVNCVQPNAAVCQMRVVNGAYSAFHNLGYYDGSAKSLWAISSPRQPAMGITFTLTNGDVCSGGIRTTTIYFDCNPKAPDPTSFNISVEAVGCNYDMHIASPYACGELAPEPNPPNPQPLTPGGGGGGLSGGSIFLIIFFVFGFVYVVGGCTFRRLSYGVSGMEACPNHEFWSALPGYVSDGFSYAWNTLTCKHAGSSGAVSSVQYDNVK